MQHKCKHQSMETPPPAPPGGQFFPPVSSVESFVCADRFSFDDSMLFSCVDAPFCRFNKQKWRPLRQQ